MTTLALAATLKRDKHKSLIMDLIGLSSLRDADIRADRGVKANRQRSKGDYGLAPLTNLLQLRSSSHCVRLVTGDSDFFKVSPQHRLSITTWICAERPLIYSSPLQHPSEAFAVLFQGGDGWKEENPRLFCALPPLLRLTGQ